MMLIEDTRQKPNKHVLKNKWWREHGIAVLRCRLPFGDYAIVPRVAVDTKTGISEIARNIGGSSEEHRRFREECKLAKAFGCKLIILIENTEGITCVEDVIAWDNPRRRFSPKAIDGPSLAKAMKTMEGRYGCVFRFCRPNEAGKVVMDLLVNEGIE